MNRSHSFGYWVRRRRKALDLSQRQLAERADCSLSAIKKIEQDTRRPSRQLAELLAKGLAISEKERDQFLRSARGLAPVDKMKLDSEPLGIDGESDERRQPIVEGNLPLTLSPFFGREDKLSRISDHISAVDTRLITLVGLGGVGKSYLAIEVARRAQSSFRDGAWFVPLAGVDDPAFLSTAIAVAQGFNFAGPLEPEQQLIRLMNGRQLLLILDNFEQLLPEGVELVSFLIQSLPQLTILVTSRQRLFLQAEMVVPVSGLPLEIAKALFVERAQRTGAELSLYNNEKLTTAIDEICQLVGGLPLAVELAAAWARLLTPAEILTNLKHSLDLLSGSLHDIPERHRSMQVVFEASWQRLSPEEQKLLAGMSIFTGSFSRDAVESICAATLSQLAVLHDHLLLQRDKDRFRLHELIRQFAVEKTAVKLEERAALKARHAAYYTDFLKHLSQLFKVRGAQLIGWEQAIDHEMDNIHVAWDWVVRNGQPQSLLPTALALSTYFDIRGQVNEGIRMFSMLGEKAVNMRIEGSANDVVLLRTQAVALAVEGSLNIRMGNIEQGQRMVGQGVSLLEGMDAPDVRITILPPMVLAAIVSRDFVGALRIIDTALKLAQREGHIWGQALALNFLGLLTLVEDKPEEARDFLSESMVLWSEQSGLIYGKVRAMIHFGLAHHALGEYEAAQSIQEEALKLSQEIQDISFAPISRCNLAYHHYAQGNFDLANAGFHEGLAEAQRFDLFNSIWHSIVGLGLVAVAKGQALRAVTILTFGLARPRGYHIFLLGEPQRILTKLRTELSPTAFATAVAQAEEMQLAELLEWL